MAPVCKFKYTWIRLRRNHTRRRRIRQCLRVHERWRGGSRRLESTRRLRDVVYSPGWKFECANDGQRSARWQHAPLWSLHICCGHWSPGRTGHLPRRQHIHRQSRCRQESRSRRLHRWRGAVVYRRYKLSYAQVFRSREFDGQQDKPNFSSINFSMTF